MVNPENPSLEQDVQRDPLEVAAGYDLLQMSDWKLVESRNGLSVFIALSRSYGALLLLCYDRADLERECAVISPTGTELLRIVGRRVRVLHEDFALSRAVIANKVDSVIDQTLGAVDRAMGNARAR
jgi:hypothetical protein